jgi:hypothetical protein
MANVVLYSWTVSIDEFFFLTCRFCLKHAQISVFVQKAKVRRFFTEGNAHRTGISFAVAHLITLLE